MVGGSLQVFQLLPPLKWYSWNIAESGIKHNKINQSIKRWSVLISLTLLGLCSIFRYYVISQLLRLEVLDDKKVEVNEKEEALRIYKRTVSL